jgi:hypothetical protein
MQLVPEPAAHGHAGIAGHEGLDAEIAVELVPERLAAAMHDPGHVLERCQAEGDGEEDLGDGHLAAQKTAAVWPISQRPRRRRPAPRSRHDLARCVELDLDGAAAHGLDALAEAGGGHAGAGKVPGPEVTIAPAMLRLGPKGRRCREGAEADTGAGTGTGQEAVRGSSS